MNEGERRGWPLWTALPAVVVAALTFACLQSRGGFHWGTSERGLEAMTLVTERARILVAATTVAAWAVLVVWLFARVKRRTHAAAVLLVTFIVPVWPGALVAFGNGSWHVDDRRVGIDDETYVAIYHQNFDRFYALGRLLDEGAFTRRIELIEVAERAYGRVWLTTTETGRLDLWTENPRHEYASKWVYSYQPPTDGK